MCRMGMRDESPRRWLLGLTDQPRITRQRSCRARWRSNNGSSNGENLTPSKAFPVVPTSTFIYVVDRSARCPRRSARLFDHLVGEREQRWRHLEAERLCGLEVDRELVLGRRLYRQVGRLLALEDAVDVSGGVPVLVKQIGTKSGRRYRPWFAGSKLRAVYAVPRAPQSARDARRSVHPPSRSDHCSGRARIP